MCAPSDIFLGLLAVLFPPLPVWIKTGLCTWPSFLNILLLLLGYLPGLIHAWYVIASYPDEAATAVYYYQPIDVEAQRGSRVPGPAGHAPAPNGYVAPPSQLGPRADAPVASYGTIDNGSSSAGPSAQQEAPEEAAPPSYDQAIKGDNKVQQK